MRVLAQNEVQFEVIAETDELGPDRECSGPAPDEGWWTVTVRAIWWSPRKRPHMAEVSVGCLELSDEYTAEDVVKERDMRGDALDALNEELRELITEAAAIGRHLELPVFEVRAVGVLEGIFPDRESAEKYASDLRTELGVPVVDIVEVDPRGRIRDLLDPKPEKPN
jgi:hypothetical protein